MGEMRNELNLATKLKKPLRIPKLKREANNNKIIMQNRPCFWLCIHLPKNNDW